MLSMQCCCGMFHIFKLNVVESTRSTTFYVYYTLSGFGKIRGKRKNIYFQKKKKQDATAFHQEQLIDDNCNYANIVV